MSEAPSTTGQEATITGSMPEEQYWQIEEGLPGFYERLAEHLAK